MSVIALSCNVYVNCLTTTLVTVEIINSKFTLHETPSYINNNVDTISHGACCQVFYITFNHSGVASSMDKRHHNLLKIDNTGLPTVFVATKLCSL